jgi:hypothetical protein
LLLAVEELDDKSFDAVQEAKERNDEWKILRKTNTLREKSSKTPKKANNNLLSLPNSNMSANSNKSTTPQAKARLFAMGGFSENKLNFNDDGKLSDDGESYDLDELS